MTLRVIKLSKLTITIVMEGATKAKKPLSSCIHVWCETKGLLLLLLFILHSNHVQEDEGKNYHAASLFLDKVLDSYLLKASREDLLNEPDDDTGNSCA